MVKPRVYIETTIPSFYYSERPAPAMVTWEQATRTWWDHHSHRYEMFTSPAVLRELEQGDSELVEKRLALLASVPVLPIDAAATDLVKTYIQQKVMPADPGGDALHLALSTLHACDFLLTWNCRHLANGNKFVHIRKVNQSLGLFLPSLVTPLQLMGAFDGTDDS